MAGLIQDSNTNAIYGHSAAAMKKAGLPFSGRKPLSDLSNSRNPFLKKASEKTVKKKKISKAPDTTRKVLSDVTNSERNYTSTKTKVTDERFDEKDIADEGFLHDHRKCMKAQRQEWTIEMDDLFESLGVPNGFPKELPSVKRPESPPRSPLRLLAEEMLEEPIRSLYQSPPESPPESPPDDCQLGLYRGDIYDCCFKLIDSPWLVKH